MFVKDDRDEKKLKNKDCFEVIRFFFDSCD